MYMKQIPRVEEASSKWSIVYNESETTGLTMGLQLLKAWLNFFDVVVTNDEFC